MTDREALFAAILAHPDDDLPRLVFADWLDEQGHPALAARAEYIRVQVEAETLSWGDRLELDGRAEELRPLFRDEWDEAEVRVVGEVAAFRRRGFVNALRVEVGRLADTRELFAAAPVQELIVDPETGPMDVFDAWNGFGRMRELARLRRLQVGSYARELSLNSYSAKYQEWSDPIALVVLLAHPYLAELRALGLTSQGLDDEWAVRFAARFAAAPWAVTLTELDLSGNQFTDAGAHALAAARGLDGLQRLGVSGNRIGPAGVAVLRARFGDRVFVLGEP